MGFAIAQPNLQLLQLLQLLRGNYYIVLLIINGKMDWLTEWGVNSSPGFAFKRILQELARDGAKDYSQTWFWSYLPNLEPEQSQILQLTVGSSVKEFLALVQQELEDADLEEIQLRQYLQPLQIFLHQEPVKQVLARAFQLNLEKLDYQLLAATWQELNLLALPEDFSWPALSKRYRRKVKAIVEESPQLRAILAVESAGEGNQENLALFTYQQELKERYGNLRLNSLHTTGGYYQVKLWNIFVPQNVRQVGEFLPQVYELPKPEQKRLRKSGEWEGEDLSPGELAEYREAYFRQPLRPVLALIEESNHPHLVILGDPGAGKTSLLQYLALQWSELPFAEMSATPLPFYVELRTYIREKESGNCADLLAFFQWSNCLISGVAGEIWQERLVSGNGRVMFDGLDEIFNPQEREKVVEEIVAFAGRYSSVGIIVTSRVIGYKEKPFIQAGFTHFMLQDLEKEQREEFINRWHNLTFDKVEERERKRQRLEKAIGESAAIGELAGNPLLLTMMAILNRNQELPRDRGELYDRCSRVLLHQWDVERALEDGRLAPLNLDYKDKQGMLRRVAYWMQSNGEGLAGNSILRERLEGIIKDYLASDSRWEKVEDKEKVARVLVENLRLRNFILCYLGGDYYSFVHRTFLEFFCAWEFVWRFEKERTIDLGYLKEKVFGRHWWDESWHEVLRLIAGMLESKWVGEILDYLMGLEDENKINLLLAAKCLAEVRNRKDISSLAKKLLVILQDLLNENLNLKAIREVMRAIAIGWQDDRNILTWFKTQAKSHKDKRIRIAVIEQIIKTWKNDIDIFPFLKSFAESDKNWEVRKAAVEELVRGWGDDSNVVTFLQSRAGLDRSSRVILALVEEFEEFAKGRKDKSTALLILKTWVESHGDLTMRQTAIEKLVEVFPDDPATLTILKSSAQSDEDGLVRRTAIEQLAQAFKEDPETLTILKSFAQSDEDYRVRKTAIEKLVELFPEDPETLTILKSSAQSDEDYWVRRTAIEKLAEAFPEDPDTLKISAQFHEDYRVRTTAIEKLVEVFPDDPATLTILKSSAQSDQDYRVRETAIEKLAEVFPEDPETLTILKSCAQSDEYYLVRRTAIEKLVEVFPEDPATLTVLKSLAQSDEYYLVRRTAIEKLVEVFPEDPATLTILKSLAQSDEEYWVRRTAIEKLVEVFPEDPKTLTTLKSSAQSDEEYWVRKTAIEKLVEVFPEDPKTLTTLKSSAQSDEEYWVRKTAIEKLVEVFPEDPKTLTTLKSSAQSDKNGLVRRTAIEKLVKVFPEDPDTLKISAQFHEDYQVRKTAIEKLAEVFPEDPETLTILKSSAQSDKDYLVRKTAIEKLAEVFPEDPATSTVLKSSAQFDKDNWVRRTAIEQLVEVFPEDPATLTILKSSAQSDEDDWVRRTAIEKLVKVFPEDPETLTTLKSSAQFDEDDWVRTTAIKKLAEGWSDRPDTFNILKDCALKDLFKRRSTWETNPRQTALEAIIKYYANHPQTIPLLENRAKDETDEIVREFAQQQLEKLLK